MQPNYTDTGIDPETGLSLRQRSFVDHLISDPRHNQTKAYLAAGYGSASRDQARKDAHILINQPDVAAYYQACIAERAERFRVYGDKVILELALIAYADNSNYLIDLTTGEVKVKAGVPQEALRAIASVKTFATTTTSTIRKGKGIPPEVITTTTWRGEIKLHDKMKALHMLCLHLGLVSAELPPLEVLFNRLGPKLSDILRRAMALVPAPGPEAVHP